MSRLAGADPEDPGDPAGGADGTGAEQSGADPFDTAGIRRRVLDAWSASPSRFREDANAEEDFALGAYRDRLLVELAQNAADAAVRAGVPGTLRLDMVGTELRAANTGAPLDAEGVASLASLRASAKRDAAAGTVGRFGVGFAAVLAVTDEPAVLSRTGGVRFSAAATRAEVAALPSLAGELARRGGAVPVLRLPWPAAEAPPDGFDTQVRLPLRPDVVEAVRAALAALPADLLLGLDGLARIEVGDRVLSRVDADGFVLLRDGEQERHWRVVSAAGTLPADLLADRPTEERGRDRWSVTWAVPVRGGQPDPLPPGQVVYAPTPSAEPLSLPARLLATFPLDAGRRHVAAGPLTDFLVARAGECYGELVRALPPTPAVLPMVPRVGLAAGALDAALARAALAELREIPWLPAGPPPAEEAGEPPSGVSPGGGRIAPRAAVVADAAGPALVGALRDVVAGLLPAEWSGHGAAAALDAVGVRRLSTRDIVELVSALHRPPSWWRLLYAGLADASDRDALAALPVPLVDGRTVIGPRDLLLSDVELPAAAAAALGLRLVHPDAAHPLLERLGAAPATPLRLLSDERVRAAVEASLDLESEEENTEVAEAVLALVSAARIRPGELPWLAELALPDVAGEWYPAGELLLPGAPLARVVAADSPFGTVHSGLLDRWGPEVLEAVGVLRTFAVLREADVEVGLAEHDLDGEAEWYDAVLDRLPEQPAPPRLPELVAVRDLELVDPDRWPQALALLAGELRPVVEAPAVLVLPDGEASRVPSYTRWWLAHHPVLAGRRPVELRLPGAVELDGLYDAADGDPRVLALAGCLDGVEAALADPELAADLLYRLADPSRRARPVLLRDVYARLATALDGYDVAPPSRVRVAPERTAARADAVVLDAPYLLPLLAGRSVVPAAGAPVPVADLVGVELASSLVGAAVASRPTRIVPWARVPGVALAATRCAGTVPDGHVAWHTGLRLTGSGAAAGREVAAPWWPDGDTDHVDTSAGPAGLGRALSWRLGRWDRRAAASEAFAAGDTETGPLWAEDAVEPPTP